MKQAISAPFHKGVNFSGWLEFWSVDQIQEDMFTREDFYNVKKLGCDVVRLPIHFERFCLEKPECRVHEKIWSILDKVVSYAQEYGLYVIFDFHNATDVDSFTAEDVGEVLIPVWKQVSERYCNASKYIVYELMNEPHGIEIPTWNKIIAEVFKTVREVDKEHYIIAGGADWNSFTAMKTLPDFQDDKVIYTFHFYDPHTFTHQGAGWCHMERVVGIPFPYDPERMPPMPEDVNDYEREKFENYAKEGTLEKVVEFFDQYVDFSIERNAPVYCGEFGCFAPFAKPGERANWYRLVTDLLEERNIARTSWDYFGAFGIFDFEKVRNIPWKERMHRRWAFPEELNLDIVRALKLEDDLEVLSK